MPLRLCEATNCKVPVERNTGSCMICDSHLCFEHAGSTSHSCPCEQDDADEYYAAYDAAKTSYQDGLIAKINLVALREKASNLRNGVSCSMPALVNGFADREILMSQMGGQNMHVDVVFEDGVTWIARIRLDDPLLAPPRTRDLIVESEVATLTFLARTKIPAPIVHMFTLSSRLDDVGVPYVLMDKLEGKPLNWSSLETSKRTKVLSQLADILIELRQHPFHQGGSLTLDSKKDLLVDSFAQTQLFRDQDVSLGPFDSTNIAAESIVDFYLDMYTSGELADFPVDNYLAFVYRKVLISEVYPLHKRQSFYLKHFDDKGDHILVDGDANITGIIDWEYASTECEELAFSSPCMLWPVADYYDGKNELSVEERELSYFLAQKGYAKLAEIVLKGRLHQRFWFFLGGGAAYDHKEFVSLFDGLRAAYAKSFDHGPEMESYEEWRSSMLNKYKASDTRLQHILNGQGAGN